MSQRSLYCRDEDPGSQRWTTLDEIGYLHELYQRGRLDLLEGALRLAPHRVWYGNGMDVDPIRVINELRDMIQQLKEDQRDSR